MYPNYTNFITHNEEEFNFLMRHLERLGHVWETGDVPTYYIDRSDYWTVMEYSISSNGNILCHFSWREGTYILVEDLIKATKKPSIFRNKE